MKQRTIEKWKRNVKKEVQFTKQIIASAQVNAGETSKNLLNEVHKTIYSIYRVKGV